MKPKYGARALFSWVLVIGLITSSLVAAIPAGRAYAAEGNVYYVDSSGGSDSNAGTSPSSAWKSLSKVNGKTNYQPGDQILFKSGGVWTGSLTLKSSGVEGSPITVGMYGDGPKPVINGNASYAAINLENIQYVTLQDLELTNYNAANPDDYLTGYYRRNGIWIKVFHNGPKLGITIRNMDIHDVTGMSVTGETTVTTSDGKDKNVNKNSNAAIQLNAWEWDTTMPKSYFDGVLIENNYIHDVSTIGIGVSAFSTNTAYYNKNIAIRGNSILRNGADGIVVGVTSNPLIESNVSLEAGSAGHGYKWIAGMWVWRTEGALFQFNEVGRVRAEAKSETDSAAFDTDISTTGDHVYQYNYSHDNEGGFFMDMGHLKNGMNIVRYNISQNDKRNAYHGKTIYGSDPGLYYNNIFYNDLGIGFQVRDNANATYMNNIFYVTGSEEAYSSVPKFYYNAFYGQPAPGQGLGSIVGDPGMVNPGHGADGLSTLEGYKLKPDSPLIGAGKAITGRGGRDFWNNPLYTGSPDIGAFEDPASTVSDTVAPATPDQAQVTGVTDSTVSLSWVASENGIPLDADIYDAATGQLAASVIVSNEAVVAGLVPGTDYRFYIVAKDRSGNPSVRSGELQARTLKAVVVDNSSAEITGNWTSATGSGSYNGGYLLSAAGSAGNTVRWTPDIPVTGYYSVFYYLPDGSASRAGNAAFTASAAGGSKTYAVDERVPGGRWVALGIHRFNTGTGGYVQLSGQANGEVAADAIKFVHLEDFGPEDIISVGLETEKLQLRNGEASRFFVYGTDAVGRVLDLAADGAALHYTTTDAQAAVVENGVVQGKGDGTAWIGAQYARGDGAVLSSNLAEVIVGPRMSVEEPLFTNASGQALTSLSPGTVNVSVRIINSTEEQKNVTLIAVLYSPAGLVQSVSKEAVVNKYGHQTLRAAVTVPGLSEGWYLKVFVWDNPVFMRPLAEGAVLQ
ncbi:MAG: hypothetical protein K0R57_5395 [Paenibacillaceae bacterium]|jgi:hypothetical protein|nr:hypothetical protein [Paenibacillaceae bacterium]